jgi:hypothetical protein
VRPRLVVPGIVELVPTYVGAEHEIRRGRLAGHQLDEDVTNWKNTYTFVALADLSLEEKVRYAPRFAEVWSADATGYREHAPPFPHLRRLLARAELLLIGSTSGHDVGPAGHVPLDGPHRVIEIGFMRTADDYFQLRVSRGKEVLAAISGAFHSIVAHAAEASESLEDVERQHLPDRILRAATSGLVDGGQIALAFMMADVVSAEAWEKHLAAVDARAEPHRDLAAEVLRAIEQDADVVEVPVFGSARRTRLPARTLRSSSSDDALEAHVDVGGSSSLALPAEDVWTLEADAEEPPRMPRELFAAARKPSPAPPRGNPALLLGIVLLVVVLVLLALAHKR